jgi:hypothetical protein
LQQRDLGGLLSVPVPSDTPASAVAPPHADTPAAAPATVPVAPGKSTRG